MARPIQTRPEELSEEFLKPDYLKKYSKRDLARKAFMKNYKRKKQARESLRYTVEDEFDRMRDFEDGVAGQKEMKYDELVEELNRDRLAIE